jgi:hypothetical protein
MKFKRENSLPSHMRHNDALPRSRQERLVWIRQKVEAGYYEQRRVLKAVAEAFINPSEKRRAGDQSVIERHTGMG